MSKEKQITKKELEVITTLQNSNSQNINQLGILEFQIQKLTKEKINITDNIEKIEIDFKAELKTLEEKYGNINLDLSTGKFTEIKETLEANTK